MHDEALLRERAAICHLAPAIPDTRAKTAVMFMALLAVGADEPAPRRQRDAKVTFQRPPTTAPG